MSSIQWDIGYIIRKRAELSADKTAVIFEDQKYTYKDLNDGANRCVHLFSKMGLTKGDRIAVILLNCMEFLESYFAAAKMGLVFVPLNWRLTGPELEYQLNDCGARLLLFHDSFFGNVQTIYNNLKVEDDKYLYLKSNSPVFPGFELPGCPDWALDFTKIVKDLPAEEPCLDQPVLMDDPLAIVYTSGVTGSPKGAVLSHLQTFFKNFQVGMYTEAKSNDVLVAQMPLFHSGGLFIVTTPAICAGTAIVMRRGFDANEFATDIERYRATIVFALTTMWRLILETGKLDQIDVSSVRCVVGGGERTPPALFAELEKRGLYMQQGFGQTENSAMMLLPKPDIQRKMGSIGKPGFFTDIWIQGSDGKKIAPGEVGEIVARGPTVMSQYWNKPEQTRQIMANGILHTGDLGYIDEEGYFYIVDRAKDMYRSGGENVYPAEIEKILSNHPDIATSAIIGVPDDKWGETGMAFIIAAQGKTITQQEILDYLNGKIAKYKYPKHFKFVQDLPMTATMKIKKGELKEKYATLDN